MSGQYSHGVNIQEVAAAATVTEIDSAVPFWVGTAPKGPVQSLTKVTSLADGIAKFGYDFAGFSIPKHLQQHFAESTNPVYIVNIYDPATATGAATFSTGSATMVVSGSTVNEVLATAATTVTTAGSAGDSFVIEVTKDGGATYETIGTGTLSGSMTGTTNAAAFKSAVNANTSAGLNTGFTAVSAAGLLTVTVPAGHGAAANSWQLRIVLPGTTSGFALSSNPASFSGGVTATTAPIAGDQVNINVGGTDYLYEVVAGDTYLTIAVAMFNKLASNSLNVVPTLTINASGGNYTVVYSLQGPNDPAFDGTTVAVTFPSNTGNTFSGAAHTNFSGGVAGAVITGEYEYISNRKARPRYNPLGTTVIKDVAGTTTYVAGTDYTIDGYGVATFINAAITDGSAVQFAYTYGDPTGLTFTDVIGGNSGGTRTGLYLMDVMYNTYFVTPTIIVTPDFYPNPSQQGSLKTFCDKYRAVHLCTFPSNKDLTFALASRQSTGLYPALNTRQLIHFGHRKYTHPSTGSTLLIDPTSRLCGLLCKIRSGGFDPNENYATSPSSHAYSVQSFDAGLQFEGDTALTFSYSDPDCDATQLNALGISCTVSVPGTPQMQWGTRNAGYPFATTKDTFINCRVALDIVESSIQNSIPAIGLDRNMTAALRDHVLNVVNASVRDWISEGILVPGSKLIYDPAQNTQTDINNGKYTFSLIADEYTPAETIVVQVTQDPTLQTAALNGQ